MIVDIAVIAALLISALIAFLRGFLREVLTIVGVVGGFFAALYGGPVFSGVIRSWMNVNEEDPGKLFDMIPYPLVADAIAYGSIFVFVVILLSVISYFASGFISSVGLGPVDRTLGVMFGIVRAILLLGLLYLPFHLLLDERTKEDLFAGSKTFFYVEWTAKKLGELLPEDFSSKEKVEEAAEGTREKLQELEILGDKEAEQDSSNNKADNAGEDIEGYSEEQRRRLDELFEDGTPE